MHDTFTLLLLSLGTLTLRYTGNRAITNKQATTTSQIPLTGDIGQYNSGDILAQQGEDHSRYGYHHTKLRETKHTMMCPEIVTCSELLLYLVLSPGSSLPLLRRGLGMRLLLQHVSGTPKSAVKFSLWAQAQFLLDHKIHTSLWRLLWANF